jgi:hypothetical protein
MLNCILVSSYRLMYLSYLLHDVYNIITCNHININSGIVRRSANCLPWTLISDYNTAANLLMLLLLISQCLFDPAFSLLGSGLELIDVHGKDRVRPKGDSVD